MELQENLETFAENRTWVCAISYDSVDVLKAFSEKFDITYPLLSDVGSSVIRRFGIYNTHVPEGHPWHGVPFPGTFMVDERGAVIEKSFYASHGARDSVARMIQEGLNLPDPKRKAMQSLQTDSLAAIAYLSSKTVRPGQVITFTAELDIESGRYIHARPFPEGQVPTRLTFQEIEGVTFEDVVYPEPKRHHLEPLGETLNVYDGRVIFKATVRNSRKEAFAVHARLEYQACDEKECYLPESIDFELPLTYLDNVKDTLP